MTALLVAILTLKEALLICCVLAEVVLVLDRQVAQKELAEVKVHILEGLVALVALALLVIVFLAVAEVVLVVILALEVLEAMVLHTIKATETLEHQGLEAALEAVVGELLT
jgi:hypothetical protein